MQVENVSLEQTLKSTDTEELTDILFYRPLGFRCAKLFARLGITPNAVTIASIFIGIAAGILFYPHNIWYNLVGMGLLVWANLFDSVDGQLARMTGNFSRWGRILDGIAGDFWFVSIYAAICLRLMNEGWHWGVFGIAAAAGFCHGTQAAMADYYRNIHLFFLKGKKGSELENSVELQKRYDATPWRGNLLGKIVQRFYLNYTLKQERLSPSMQRLRQTMVAHYGEGEPPQWLREEFRAKSLPLMKYTNMLTFNTRAYIICLSIAIGMPWIFFACELTIFNLMLWYMVSTHGRICREFTKRIEEGKQ